MYYISSEYKNFSSKLHPELEYISMLKHHVSHCKQKGCLFLSLGRISYSSFPKEKYWSFCRDEVELPNLKISESKKSKFVYFTTRRSEQSDEELQNSGSGRKRKTLKTIVLKQDKDEEVIQENNRSDLRCERGHFLQNGTNCGK